MRLYGTAVLALAIAVLACGLRAAAEPKGGELDGTWVVESMTFDGKEAPPEKFAKLKEVIKGNEWTMYADDKVAAKGKFKFDTSKNPRAIDSTAEVGPNKGKTYLAIYKLDGNKVTVCVAGEGDERPTEFSSKAGSKRILAVYKRQTH